MAAAALGREIGSVEKECTQTFDQRDKTRFGLDAQRIAEGYRRFGQKYGRFTLISTLEMSLVAEKVRMRLIVIIPAGLDGYGFYLNSVAYDRPKTGLHLPRCTPAQLRIGDRQKARG